MGSGQRSEEGREARGNKEQSKGLQEEGHMLGSRKGPQLSRKEKIGRQESLKIF